MFLKETLNFDSKKLNFKKSIMLQLEAVAIKYEAVYTFR